MEKKMTAPFLFILLHLLPTSTVGNDDCPSLPQKSLTCFNDYSHNITCVWKTSSVSGQKNNVCSIYAERVNNKRESYKNIYIYSYNASCELRSIDSASPGVKKCSLAFNGTYLFNTFSEVSMNLSCFSSKQSEIIFYKPKCHIKVNPPRKPEVNFTTVSCFSQVLEHKKIEFSSQVQWKQKEQQWSDLQIKNCICKWKCEAQLEQNSLQEGKTYEARVRVLARNPLTGTWSDWSPSVSWVPRPRSGKDVAVLNLSILSLAVFGLLLLPGLCFTMYKTPCSKTYILKKITSPSLPNPAKSVHFQTWMNSYFTSESYHSFLKSVETVSVEVTSVVDAITLCKPNMKVIPEKNKYESSCSSFSNHSYSGFCSSPLFPLTSGSLEPCAIDTSYKNVCGHEEEKNEQQNSDVAKIEMEMVKAFLMGRLNHQAVMISDYQQAHMLQAELHRLCSVDSGISTYEEVSQESMEADSINMTDGHDEGIPCKQETQEVNNEGNEIKSDVQKLFEGSEMILGKNSIVSGYKQIPMIQAENADLLRLHSTDSGMSSYEEVIQESVEEDSLYMTEGHNEESLSKERKEKDFQKLFGGSESIFYQSSPQVFSDYKQIPMMQAESLEFPSLDSGVCRVDEESLGDSMEEEDKTTEGTHFLFPPFSSTGLAKPLVFLSQQPLDTSRSKLGSVLPPLQTNDIFKEIIQMSDNIAHQPCGNGYIPVRQKQSKESEA